jgi:DNA-directed RNA polymerase subunit K/omega
MNSEKDTIDNYYEEDESNPSDSEDEAEEGPKQKKPLYEGVEDDTDEEEDDEIYEEMHGGDEIPLKSAPMPKMPFANPMPNQTDSDEEEEEDENYLQKFDVESNQNYISNNHPECIVHNYDEINSLKNVVRDNNNIIIDPLHKTIPILTKYEKTRVLGQRAKQIEYGARPFIKVPESVIDSYIIAELELKAKAIPFIIRRPLPNGACEYWNLKDLEVIAF